MKRNKPLKRIALKRSSSKLKRSRIKKYGSHTHRDYSRKVDYVKALRNKGEALWKKLGKILHGNECEVKKNYPNIYITHTPVIQGDHCISRMNKYFFLDIRNHSSVCAGCNSAKSGDNKSVARAIDDIVKKRHPEWFKDAVWLDQTREANPNWHNPVWLEEQIKDLEEKLNELP